MNVTGHNAYFALSGTNDAGQFGPISRVALFSDISLTFTMSSVGYALGDANNHADTERPRLP